VETGIESAADESNAESLVRRHESIRLLKKEDQKEADDTRLAACRRVFGVDNANVD
jgi:hypothetical protein